MKALRGILPPIVTPFDAEGDVDFDALSHNVERWNGTELAGLVVFGSNGEAVHLGADEQAEILGHVRRDLAPGKLLVAGVNEHATRGAVAAVRRAADAGADAALVVTPYFYKGGMTQDVLRRFFLDVAESSPLPLVVYNVPQMTGVTIAPATVGVLAEHERIVGVKDSSGSLPQLLDLVRLTPDDFRVLVGNASILFPALVMGAAGGILAVAQLVPDACVEILRAVERDDTPRARDLQTRLAPLGHVVTAGLGIAGLKVALDRAGYRGGLPRRPLLPLEEGDRDRVVAAMDESGLLGT